MIEIHKMHAELPISHEMLYPDLEARTGHIEPPTQDELDAYNAWRAKFEPLRREGRKRGWFTDGGPDYGFEYERPQDRFVYDEDET